MVTQKEFDEKFGTRMSNLEYMIKNCHTLKEMRVIKVLVNQLEKDVERFIKMEH